MTSATLITTLMILKKIVDEFFNEVDRKFVVADQVEVRCKFSITKCQPPENEFLTKVIDQTLWLTDFYFCKYLNRFVKYSLKRDILKPTIINGHTSRSWRFKKSNKINIIA